MINKTTVIQEIGTYYALEKRPDKTNIARMD